MERRHRAVLTALFGAVACASPSLAWHDETHLAVAKAAGYAKWYNAAGADITKIKAGDLEQNNHYVNNPETTREVTPGDVAAQIGRYNTLEPTGHLYGAIVAAVRNYRDEKSKGKYGEYHLAFAAHYVGDLSMPLHNWAYDDFNKKNHAAVDGLVNDEVLAHLERLPLKPVPVRSEDDLVREVARLATRSLALARTLEAENRLPTREEVYAQLGLSASLLRGILDYTGAPRGAPQVKP